MSYARQESERFNHDYIGTEHILLGLEKEGCGVAANVFENLDIDLKNIRIEVEQRMKLGRGPSTPGQLPFTPRGKKVLEYAIDEARNLGHNYVGTEHLLLGILREGEGVAGRVLINFGLDLENVRTEVMYFLGREAPMRRPFIRIHLSTALMCMLAASLMMWLNFSYSYPDCGFPFRHGFFLSYYDHSTELAWILNLFINLNLLILFATISEWIIRRRERKHQPRA